MDTKIKPLHYDLIKNRILEGRCVPFLGAGVNVSSEDFNYKGLPLAYELALHFAEKLTKQNREKLVKLTTNSEEDIQERIRQLIETSEDADSEEDRRQNAAILQGLFRATLPNLARLALHVKMDGDSDYLMDLVRKALPDEDCEPSPLLKFLAKVRKPAKAAGNGDLVSPFRLIVTTNYDNLLERAFRNCATPYEKVVQNITGFEDRKNLDNRLSKPNGTIIYKIHGSFKNESDVETKKGLVLTEEDYIEFLSNFEDPIKGVPRLIRSELVSSEIRTTESGNTEIASGTTILFLGYSLEDWDFQAIYKTFVEPINPRPQSFAIQKNPPDFWVTYWEKKGVKIFDMDLYKFANKLESYLQ